MCIPIGLLNGNTYFHSYFTHKPGSFPPFQGTESGGVLGPPRGGLRAAPGGGAAHRGAGASASGEGHWGIYWKKYIISDHHTFICI